MQCTVLSATELFWSLMLVSGTTSPRQVCTIHVTSFLLSSQNSTFQPFHSACEVTRVIIANTLIAFVTYLLTYRNVVSEWFRQNFDAVTFNTVTTLQTEKVADLSLTFYWSKQNTFPCFQKFQKSVNPGFSVSSAIVTTQQSKLQQLTRTYGINQESLTHY